MKLLSDKEIEAALKKAFDEGQEYTLVDDIALCLPEREVARSQLDADLKALEDKREEIALELKEQEQGFKCPNGWQSLCSSDRVELLPRADRIISIIKR